MIHNQWFAKEKQIFVIHSDLNSVVINFLKNGEFLETRFIVWPDYVRQSLRNELNEVFGKNGS